MPLTMLEKRQALLDVDEQGFIVLGEDRLCQRDAAILAWHLIDAVDRSINRSQIRSGGQTTTEMLLRRMETPLYKAKDAIGRLF